MIRTAPLALPAASAEAAVARHPAFFDARAMRCCSHARRETRTRQTGDGMIASQAKTGCELVPERDGVAIGKAGMRRIGEIGEILHPKFGGWG